MNGMWARIRNFWGAEEIPRSIGLLLVLVYVVALGAVGTEANRGLRAYAVAEAREASAETLRVLADTLEPATEANTPELLSTLNKVARSPRYVALRVYDHRMRVLASLASAEVGQPLPAAPDDVSPTPESIQSTTVLGSNTQHERIHVRAPLLKSGLPATQFIEGVVDFSAPAVLANPLHLWTLLIALTCTGAFLLIYRRLRRYFHTYSRIAGHLVNSANQLETRISELRIHDAKDEVASCWNKLMDVVAALEEDVARSTASSELLEALSQGDGGELAVAMTTVPLGVILANEHGVVTYSNAMANRLVGWSQDADKKHSLDDEGLTVEGGKVVEYIRKCLIERGSSRTLDAQIEGEDGSFYHVQAVPVRSQHPTDRFVVLIQDISQKVRADKAREEFVSQVTHELRTPLTNIRAYAETLSSGMFDDPQVITECYNVITKETRRLSRLIEDILSISQLEVGTMQLVVDDVDLRSLLTDAVRDVRGIAESKTIDLQLVLPPKLSPLRGDRDKLAVVVNNLLGNAIKYTPEGGNVVVSCKADADDILISVRDSGIGIDAKDHSRIFEKFQRADDPNVRNETGTGIGLTTAREVAQQHGGDITVVSKLGEGATFTVSLPAGKTSQNLVEATN